MAEPQTSRISQPPSVRQSEHGCPGPPLIWQRWARLPALILSPNRVRACFFSNALDILPLSNIAIPIGRSCGHLTKSSELTRSDLRQVESWRDWATAAGQRQSFQHSPAIAQSSAARITRTFTRESGLDISASSKGS